MLPLQQAREVRDSIIEHIKVTFKLKEKDVCDAFYSFIEDKENTPQSRCFLREIDFVRTI
jgi:DEAD/DEAH box helicase domain-containing protein